MVTPNKYRFILGRSADTSVNLLTNGTFTGSLAPWITSVSPPTTWTYSANTAVTTSAGSGVLDYAARGIHQVNVVTPNNFYHLEYDLKADGVTGVARMSWSMGGAYMTLAEQDVTTNTGIFTTFTNRHIFAPKGNDFWLVIHQGTAGVLDNVKLYREIWNAPLTYEPVNWDESRITKKRDEQLNGLIIQYIADLTFIEDGYDYLYNEYITYGFCSEIPVRIEVYNSDLNVYELFFEGVIFISDCKFNTTKRQVTVNIEDSNSSLIFLRSKDKKVDMRQNSPDDIDQAGTFPKTGVIADALVDFNNDAGAYVYTGIRVYTIGDLLRRVIIQATNFRLDAESVFFSSGTFAEFAIGVGAILRTGAAPGVNALAAAQKLSIEKLFNELNNLFDLSFSIDSNSDGVSTIKIEPKINYLSATPVLVLNFINGLEFIFDKKNIVKTVNIGYEFIDDTASTNNLNTPEGVQYYSDNNCGESNFNLVSRYIQKSTILKKMLAGTITSDKFDATLFWIEVLSSQTRNSGSGTHDYNINIDFDDNMARWVQTLQLSVIKSNNAANPDTATKSNAILDKIYTFEYPITKAQFDLIVQAYNTIEFNTDGTGLTTKQGFLLEANYLIKTGLTQFKLLSN